MMAPKDLIENVLAPKLMEGHNFLHLNEATLKVVIQEWVDMNFPKAGKVVAVTKVTSSSPTIFEVALLGKPL